jgi:hypothetical protein
MDPATIQQIAAEIARHLPSYAWMQLLVAMLLMAIAGAVGAFFGEYLKTRAKNLATKADLESIKAQLSDTTQVVEAIKSEVGQRDWAQREWTNLRRTKLEALLDKMHDCDVYLERQRDNTFDAALSGKLPDIMRDPVSELTQIAELYFPELLAETRAFTIACRDELKLGYDLRPELLATAPGDADARKKALVGYRDALKQTTPVVLKARQTLTEAARRLLVSIMGVQD